MNIKKYEGDDKFKKILKEIKCPSDLNFIKALLQGSLAATQTVMPSVIINEIFAGKEIDFKSKAQVHRFMSNFLGLWNQYASQVQEGIYTSPNAEKNDLLQIELMTYIIQLLTEILTFLRGLYLGFTDVNEMSPDGQVALMTLEEADVFLKKAHRLLKKKKAKAKDIKETTENINNVHRVKNDCMQRIIKGLEESRKLHLESLKIPVRREKIGRNDPCPCGSGKKYKNCCGLKTPTNDNTYH
jgi:uncharacterized protein YecA (UPF0149 family)